MFNIYIPRDTSQVFLFFLIISHFVTPNQNQNQKRKKEEAVTLFFWFIKVSKPTLCGFGLSPSWFESVVARGRGGHFFPGRWLV